MIELTIYSVLYSLLTRHRIVLLKEVLGERYLPIWIGIPESDAIANHLQGTTLPRPLTHDLLLNTIRTLKGTVHYIVINDLVDDTFFARIAVAVHERRGLQQILDNPVERAGPVPEIVPGLLRLGLALGQPRPDNCEHASQIIRLPSAHVGKQVAFGVRAKRR